jgi:hypothetical protein
MMPMSTVRTNLTEIRDTIVAVLEENGRPMMQEALANSVNGRCGSRFSPDMIVRTFLKVNPDLFGQTRDGLWGLKQWEPRVKYGVVDVIRVATGDEPSPQPGLFGGSGIRPEPYPQDMRTILMDLLTHLTPETNDQELLNEISFFELEQATYRVDKLVTKRGGEASDANTLVPRRLHEKMSYQSWRFPPKMEMACYIQPKPGRQPSLSLELIYGLASMLEYRDEQLDQRGRLMFRDRGKANPALKIPRDFGKIRLNDSDYSLSEDERPFDYARKSGPLRFLQFSVSETIPGLRRRYEIPANDIEPVLVKLFDQSAKHGEQVKSVDVVSPYRPSGLQRPPSTTKPRAAAIALRLAQTDLHLLVESEFDPTVNAYRLTVQISNQTDKVDYPLVHSLVMPHLKIKIEGADILLPEQQHAKRVLEATRNGGHPSVMSELLRPSQTNCVVTRSVKDSQMLVCTTFGVYDTVRIRPREGPKLADLYRNGIDGFLAQANVLSAEAKTIIRGNSRWADLLPKVMCAIEGSFFDPRDPKPLYLYQWEAIQHRIEMLCRGTIDKVSVINAPTGAGKTLVFFANAALHYLFTGERAALVFPTRILNEDMFKRLTRFVYALRQELPDANITGGIFIGSSDPSYKAIMEPALGQPMVQYEDGDGSCPRCRRNGQLGQVRCQERDGRRIGICEVCGHAIDYMYSPRRIKITTPGRKERRIAEVAVYLPALTIATPDKLYYEATVAAPQGVLPFFGAPALKCTCGAHYSRLYSDVARADIFKCQLCGGIVDSTHPATPEVQSPLAYFVFDEVHSLYGVTATLISYFFNLLREMTREMRCPITGTFETGTATIANERPLVETLTRQPYVELFPDKSEFLRYFRIEPRWVRYRTLMFMPVGTPTVRSLSNAIKYTYEGLHVNGQLKARVGCDDYDFLLAYIPRKQHGHIVTNDVWRYVSRKGYFLPGARIRFLSGDSRASTIAKIYNDIREKNVNLLTANMVVSLGLDIPRLNNMLMMGVPQSMTEMVQTAGRTGRADAPGHVTVHLLPSNPRNEFFFRNFHRVMSDVEGYLDEKFVRPVNPYAADLILNNVISGLLHAKVAQDISNTFCGKASVWLTKDFFGQLLFEILAKDEDPAIQREVARAIQSRYWSIASTLGNEGSKHVFQWVSSQPDTLFSLRATSDRIDVSVRERDMFEKMKGRDMPQRAVSEDFFSVEDEA